jgi:hypothetical protein
MLAGPIALGMALGVVNWPVVRAQTLAAPQADRSAAMVALQQKMAEL